MMRCVETIITSNQRNYDLVRVVLIAETLEWRELIEQFRQGKSFPEHFNRKRYLVKGHEFNEGDVLNHYLHLPYFFNENLFALQEVEA